MSMKDNKMVEVTKNWIRDFVIKLNLCPFAKIPFEGNLIRYEVSHAMDLEGRVSDAFLLCDYIASKDREVVSNGFTIFARKMSFEEILDVKAVLDELLCLTQKNEVIQTVAFHPEYLFEKEEVFSNAHLTNRSPFPMIHVLRVEEVAEMIHMYGDLVKEVPHRNKKLLEQMDYNELLQTSNIHIR